MPTEQAIGQGWKIETRYNPRVLVGNWQEDRMTNERKFFRPTTTYKLDYISHPDARPDVLIRRYAALDNTGLPTSTIAGHASLRRKDEDLVTWYDEDYNRRPREGLPPLRTWNSNTLSWGPEKSDHPLPGPPTNYGLYSTLKQKWGQSEERMTSDSNKQMTSSNQRDTTYRSSYSSWSPDHYLSTTRYTIGGHLPSLKPSVGQNFSPADTAVQKPGSPKERGAYMKIVSLRPVGVSSPRPVESKSTQSTGSEKEQLNVQVDAL